MITEKIDYARMKPFINTNNGVFVFFAHTIQEFGHLVGKMHVVPYSGSYLIRCPCCDCDIELYTDVRGRLYTCNSKRITKPVVCDACANYDDEDDYPEGE